MGLSRHVAAVIVNWNSAPDTLRCVQAIAAGNAIANSNVVVDNGSTDDSRTVLAESSAPLTLINLPKNLGFAGGANAGARAAIEYGATHIWLLNPDALPSATALSELLDRADDYDVSASLQVSSPHPWGADATPYTSAAMLPGGHVRPVDCPGCPTGHHPVDVVTGASLLVGAVWMEKVGYIDESFFHYKEEFDLVVRIRMAGGRAGFVCASRVWHQRGASLSHSSPDAQYYHYRNEILYLRKHYRRPLVRMLTQEPIHYRTVLRAAGRALGGGERGQAGRAVLAGYRDGVRGIGGPIRRP
jgi:GT2 family glycosyltransferase